MGKKQQRIRARKASAAAAPDAPVVPAPAAPAAAPGPSVVPAVVAASAAPAAAPGPSVVPVVVAAPTAPAVPAPAAPAAAPGPSVVLTVVALDIPWNGYKEAIETAIDGNPHSDIIFGFTFEVSVEKRTIIPVAIEISKQNRNHNRNYTIPLADLVQFPTEQKVASKMRRRG